MKKDLTQLIKQCKKRDIKAQKELYNSFCALMYAVCLRYLKNPDDAQDVLQDGFILVFKKIDSFKNRGSFEGWIKRIFINLCLKKLKERKRTLITENYELNNIKDQDTDEAVNYGICRERLFAFIEELPDGYRAVFNLYVLDGYSHKEIANTLSITEGTSKSQLARAKKYLKEKLTLVMDE